MTYDTAQKQRLRAMAQLFREAHAHVLPRRGLCSAVRKAAAARVSYDHSSHEDCHALINRALAGHLFLSTWQQYRGIHRTEKQLLADRHAWLDQLIADIEAAVQS